MCAPPDSDGFDPDRKPGEKDQWRASAGERAALANRTPRLPKDNPSSEELKAYEAAYRAALAGLAPDDQAFTDEWRENERALVGVTASFTRMTLSGSTCSIIANRSP